PLLVKCYPADTLAKLAGLKAAIDSETDAGPYRPLLWIALVTILRRCSPVGTAPWQYVLPSKRKSRPSDPFRAFDDQVETMATDMREMSAHATGASATLYEEDARSCPSVPADWADLVVTSPPYPNNYDYADATRLEMTFFGEIGGWTDLQAVVRKRLIHSCSQHEVDFDAEQALSSPLLRPISGELRTVYESLCRERLVHGGRKTYNKMVVAYFLDLARVWTALRRVTRPGGRVCFVVGDSAPYGIHVPVERWLGELSVSVGFRSYEFEKLRDRNTKWLNRKHRVPLQEGRLWVEA
ncbi:DNA modification methyltransferase, partial [mine drainage metagenome]